MLISSLKSSIGRKFVMALTGIFLLGFVIAHMIGNLQIFLGAEAINSYAEHLEEMPYLLWPARIFLLVTLSLHVVSAISLAIQNKNARPIAYSHQSTIQASYASRTMVMSGVIILAFIIFHLAHFTFGRIHPEFAELADIEGRHDVYSMVILGFQDKTVSAIYIFAMTLLCLHLSHGISSFFQSIGLSNQKSQEKFKKLAKLIALAIFVGNTSIPIASMLGILQPIARGM